MIYVGIDVAKDNDTLFHQVTSCQRWLTNTEPQVKTMEKLCWRLSANSQSTIASASQSNM